MQPLAFEDIYRNQAIEKWFDGYLIVGEGETEESGCVNIGGLSKVVKMTYKP